MQDKTEKLKMVDKFVKNFISVLSTGKTQEERTELIKEKYEKTLSLFDITEDEYIQYCCNPNSFNS